MTFTTDFSGQHFLPIGSCIAEFEIKGLIGEGGFGTVYLAFDHSLLRTVALKEFLPTSLAQRGDSLKVVLLSERNRETFEAGMKSFINEARLLAQFDHPALVKVYRFWESNNTAYMVMPFYEGVSLKQVIHEHPERIDEAYLRGILAPLLDALEYLHQSQIYHRDIAPDNIMILDSGMPVLLDFGAARRVMKDMTQALTIILKPGFAPIEQYADDVSLKQGSWTDIYGLCAVLYYAILGKTPPTAVSRMVKDNMQALVSNPALAHFSPSFLAAIDAGLAVNPEDRIQTTEQFRHRIGLRTYILPGTNPPSVVSDREAVGNSQKSEGLITSEPEPAEDPAATKLLLPEEPLPKKQAEGISHQSNSTKDEQASAPSQHSAEKLEETANSDQTIVIFNSPTPSSLPEAFSVDAAAPTIHLPSLDSSASKQSSSDFFTKASGPDDIQALPAAEDLLATRILNPEALRKVMEAEREEAKKREFDQDNKKSSLEVNPPSSSNANTQDLPTRILPSSNIKAKSEQAMNKPALSRPSRPKLVHPPSNRPKLDSTKAKIPNSLIKPVSKGVTKSKRPTLFIIFGALVLMALLGAIGIVSLQKQSKTNNPVSTAVVTVPPVPPPPAAVEVPPPSTAQASHPSDLNAAATAPSAPPVGNEVSLPVPQQTVPQVPPQVLPELAAQGEKPQENPPSEVVKADLPEKSSQAIAASEKSKPRVGTVHLAVKPWGTVTVDGTNQGVSPPLKTLTLPEGRYAVKIENPGFTPFVTTIEVKKGKTLPLSYNFSTIKKSQTP